MQVKLNRKPNNEFSVSMLASLEEAYIIKGMTGMCTGGGNTVRVYTDEIWTKIKNTGLDDICMLSDRDINFSESSLSTLIRLVANFKHQNRLST